MARLETDVFVAGGGIAGLTAALGFAGLGFDVALADPAPPPADGAAPRADLRSTAFLQPSQALFQRIGLWPDLAAAATPLQVLRVADTAGWPPRVTELRSFDAADLGPGPFGWNLPNRLTRRRAHAAAAAHPRVALLPTGFAGMLVRTAGARVQLADGRQVGARLVVAADGRDSAVREAAGIAVDTRRYGQKALAFSVAHTVPHDNVSTEIYARGGAFTTVPLADHSGRPASAIVWMNDGPQAVELASLAPAELGAAATERSAGLLGAMTPLTDVQVWPVITRTANRLTAERTALVAEAAHVLPPIGAQGLNTSLHDIAALLDLAAADPARLGEPPMLAAYGRARARDIAARARAIDAFNRLCRSGAPAAQAIRRTGLRTIYDLPPLRRTVMKAGLGTP